jgi:hypothetical protein
MNNMSDEQKNATVCYLWMALLCALGAGLLLCSGCQTNPLVGPMDTFLNETGGPYMEDCLVADLASGTKDEAFVAAKRLELEALRALIKEAKNE